MGDYMNEEKDRVRTQLLDFEMSGSITKRQKDVISREIADLIKDAAGQRDALELSHLQAMQSRLDRIKLKKPVNFFSYLKDIFTEGQRIVFTVFDIVGIVLFFFPSLAQSLINDVALTRIIGGSIFFIVLQNHCLRQ